jgi:hypothetical protein
MENRNMVTTNATAQLLHSIVGGVAVSAVRSQAMMALIKRSLNPADWASQDEENQVTGFLGSALPKTPCCGQRQAGLVKSVMMPPISSYLANYPTC